MNTHIRAATPDDLYALVDLWQERRVILSQFDASFRLSAGEREAWINQMSDHLDDTAYRVLAAENDANPVGYICGHLKSDSIGLIEELALDAHRYHGGVARQLVNELLDWFKQHGANEIVVLVSRRLAVEQAFWRSLGAVEWINESWQNTPHSMWMKL